MSATATPAPSSGRWLRRLCVADQPEQMRIESGLDHARILELARIHRLEARAGARMERIPEPRPAWTRHLVSAWRRTLGEQALQREMLEQLAAAATSAGIELLVLKGPDLARRVYGPGERASNDLDLLVEPSRLEAAEEVLASCGYACDHPAPLAARRHWFASTYRHAERPRIQVDLHWGLGTPGRVRWRIDEVFRRAEPMPGAAGLRRMEIHDLMVYLALHAVAFHGASGRWVWWLDLHLLTAAGQAQRTRLLERAREVGGRVALGAALARARELFAPGAALPIDGGWRARRILSAARRNESRPAARRRRWYVAALAVDRPTDLVRVGLGVLRRGSDREAATRGSAP